MGECWLGDFAGFGGGLTLSSFVVLCGVVLWCRGNPSFYGTTSQHVL